MKKPELVIAVQGGHLPRASRGNQSRRMVRRSLKVLAVCAGLAVFGWGFALSYGLYTPSDLRKIDLCIEPDRWGGSADYFGYVLIRCSSGDELERLSSAEVTFRLTPLPPHRLRYDFVGDRVVGLAIVGTDVEYRLDRVNGCFVRTKGPPGGMVGECWIRPIKRSR